MIEDFINWIFSKPSSEPGPNMQTQVAHFPVIELCPVHGYHKVALAQWQITNSMN